MGMGSVWWGGEVPTAWLVHVTGVEEGKLEIESELGQAGQRLWLSL
jgi:hypothetical protein